MALKEQLLAKAREQDGLKSSPVAGSDQGVRVVENPTPYPQQTVNTGADPMRLIQTGNGIADRLQRAVTPQVSTEPTGIKSLKEAKNEYLSGQVQPRASTLSVGKLSRDGFAMDEELGAKYGSYENYLTNTVTDEYKRRNPNTFDLSQTEAMAADKFTVPKPAEFVKPSTNTGLSGFAPVTAADQKIMSDTQAANEAVAKSINRREVEAANQGFRSLEAYREFQLQQYNRNQLRTQAENELSVIDTAVAQRDEIQNEINYLSRTNLGAGNIDLSRTPRFDNGDGTYSTVDSMSFHDDKTGLEILIPTVVQIDGTWYHVDEDTAIEQYRRTGQYLGAFRTVEDANAYAIQLHQQQEELFARRSELSAQYQASTDLIKSLSDKYNNGVYKDYTAANTEFLRTYDPTAYYLGEKQSYSDIENVIKGLDAQLENVPAGSARYNTLKRQRDMLYADRMLFATDEELEKLYAGGDYQPEKAQVYLSAGVAPAPNAKDNTLVPNPDRTPAGDEIARRNTIRITEDVRGTEAGAYLDALAKFATTGDTTKFLTDLGYDPGQVRLGEITVENAELKIRKALTKQGYTKKEANDVIQSYLRQGNRLQSEAQQQEIQSIINGSDLAEPAGWAAARILNLVGAITAPLAAVKAGLTDTHYSTLDPNDPRLAATKSARTIDSTIMGKHDIPIQTLERNIDLFDEAYGVVSSGVDSLMASVIPGGEVVLGASAAAQSILESAERGDSIGTAITTGFIAGAFESLFEHVSISQLRAFREADNVFTYGQILDNVRKSIATNFEEEAATTLANSIFDWLSRNPNSNFNTSIGELMTQINPNTGRVYTEKEARSKTWADIANSVFHDGVVGAIQGAFMSGASQISSINTVRKINAIMRTDAQDRGYIANTVLAASFTGGESQSIGRAFLDRLDTIIESKDSDAVKRQQFKNLVAEMRQDLDRLPDVIRKEAPEYAGTDISDPFLRQYVENVRNLDDRPIHVESETETKVRDVLKEDGVTNQKVVEAAQKVIRQVMAGSESINFSGVDTGILNDVAFQDAVYKVTGSTVFSNNAAAVKRSLQNIANNIRNRTVSVNQTEQTATPQSNLVEPGPSLVITGEGERTAVMTEESANQLQSDRPEPGSLRAAIDRMIPGYASPAATSTEAPSDVSYGTEQTVNTDLADSGYDQAVPYEPTNATETETATPTEPTIRSGDEDLTEAQFVEYAVRSGEVTPEQARAAFRRMVAGDQSQSEADNTVRFAVAEAQNTQRGANEEPVTGPMRTPELDDTRRRMQAVMNFFLSDKNMRIQYTDDPRLAGENGMIDLKDGTIYVNINAPEADSGTQAGLAWILGHEIFHGAKFGENNSELINQVLGTYDENGELIEDGLIQKLTDAGALTGYYAEIARSPEKMRRAVKQKQELYETFYKGRSYKPEDYAKYVSDDAIREEIAGDILGSILGVNTNAENWGKFGTNMPRADLFDLIAGMDARPLYAAELTLKDRLRLMRESGVRGKDFDPAYDTTQQQVKSLLYDISSALDAYRDRLESMKPSSEYETNGGEPAPEDINPDFAEAKLSVASPYKIGSEQERVFVENLSTEARKTYDVFDAIHKVGQDNQVQVYVGSGEKRHLDTRDISTVFMQPAEWNDYVKNDPAFADVAVKLATTLPDDIRRNANINMDGTISETPFEKEFKMSRSFAQRVVDALPKQTASSIIMSGGREIRLSDRDSVDFVGGEAYRRALVEERRRLRAEGKLPTKAISALGKDEYGAMGFLATNSKTIASGDFTTLCPQMYYNKGCFYCYRRNQLTTGMNLKLLGESVWYTGEILQLRQKDIDRLNRVGGLRIQSFGDWMDQFSGQLADMLMDADSVGLQVKIITKEPSMIKAVARLKDQGIGNSVFFNLSADYVIEPRGEIHNTDQQDRGWDPSNPNRPFMTDDQGVARWKRALTVEEAYEYRKQYPWVKVRIVAGRVEEFIRGLSDPRVQVVTGFHGNKNVIDRLGGYGYVDSATGETVLELEPIGDNGMPKFIYNPASKSWVTTFAGKQKVHHKLAQAISDAGLEAAYYMKSCCVTGQCATCQGTCGKVADNFFIKNATDASQTTPAYWQTNMQSAEDENLLIDEAEEANAMLKGEADDQLQEEEDLRLPSVQRHSVAEMQAAGKEYDSRINSGTFFSGGGLVDYALRDQINSSMAVEWDKGAAAVFTLNNGSVYVGDVRDYVNGEDIQKLKGKLEYFHASPVCKNYSRMNIRRNTRADNDNDMVTAQATADAIGILTPKVFTLEQVPEYLGSDALKIITDRLDALGYTWDVNVANAFDYGGATSRERLMLRAIREGQLPALPQKSSGYSWYEATSDLLDSLPDATVQPFLQERIDNTPRLKEALSRAETPILVLQGNAGRQARWITADKPCPSITTDMHDARVLFPDGTVKKATPRFFARTMGLPDSYQFTQWRGGDNQTQGYKVVGNGVPVQLTQAFFGDLLRNTIGSQTKYAGTEYANEDVRRSIAGPSALTADKAALRRAMEQTARDRSEDSVFRATHWWRDPADGKWRFEINDDKARFVKRGDADLRNDPQYEAARKEYRELKRAMKERQLSEEELKRYNELKKKVVGEREAVRENFWRGGGKIGDIIDHKLLFDAYPELKDVAFSFEHFKDPNLGGHFIPWKNKIELNDRFLGDTAAAKNYRNQWRNQLADGMDATEENVVLSILLHEMQHKIQSIEGFARGGSTDSIINAQEAAKRGSKYYWSEARNLEKNTGLNVMNAMATLQADGDLDVIDNDTGVVVATISPAESTPEARVKAVEDWITAERDAGNITFGQWDDARRVLPRLMQAEEDRLYATMLNDTTTSTHNLYEALRGEQESRMVQKRQNMTAAERWANRPQMPRDYKLVDIMDRITGRYDSQGRSNEPYRYSVSETEKREVAKQAVDVMEKNPNTFIDPGDGEDVRYSIAEADQRPNAIQPLRNKDGSIKYVYKAFYAMDGKLYPPMVSNLSDEEKRKVKNAASGTMRGIDTPMGVWLRADVGTLGRYTKDTLGEDGVLHKQGELLRNKSGRLRVQNDKGGGTLAFRPGWHSGEWPDAKQFNKDSQLGKRTVMPRSLVFARCIISGDVDYQLDAMELGMSETGSFNRSQAGLPFVPENGYYKYRTNADPNTAPWYISGAIKIVEILDDEQCREICAEYGITPDPREDFKPIDLAEFGLQKGPVTAEPEENWGRYAKSEASIRNDAELQDALNDPNFRNAYARFPVNFENSEIQKEFARNSQDPEYYREMAKDRPGYENARYSVADNAATPNQDQQIMDIVRRMQSQARTRDVGPGAANFGFTQQAAQDVEDWMQSGRTYNTVSDEQRNNTRDYRANRDAVQYPRTVDKSGKITSRAAQTIRNAGITDDSMASTLDQAAAAGAFDFSKQTDDKAMKKARAAIERNGWAEEYAKYKDAVDKGLVSKDNTAMGMALYQAAATEGDNYAALDLALLMARDGNNVGAALQARRIMNKLGPDGQLYMAVRGVENIADHIRQLYPDKQITLDRSLLEAYRNALISGDQEAIDRARGDINQAVADQLPADWKEKLNNWRYMSMLTNPTTHVRNVLGNAGFAIPRMMKQAMKAGFERVSMGKAGEGSNRTTAILNPLSAEDRARFMAGWDDYKNVMDLIQSGGKQTGPRDEIEKLRTIYNNRLLEGVRKGNSGLLDLEDTWFSRPAYAEALASYLKARGIDGADYATGNISDEMKTKAQDHAIREAQKATYRDHNQFSDMIADLGKKGKLPTATRAQKIASAAIEAVLPFKRTPANILARAVEYSPAELIQVVFSDIGKVHRAQAEARAAEARNDGSEATIRAVNAAREAEAGALSTMFDHIASSATGTGLLLVGALLRHLGVLHGGADDDKDQAAFDKTRGIQEYSIDIGGKNYTLDWLAPEILPVFTGVALYDKLVDRESRSENGIIGDLGDILIGMTEPMLNMSMLQSVNDLITTVKYLDEGAQLAGIAKNVGYNYLSQYIPTLGGKIESIVEPTRSTTFIDKNSALGKDEQYLIAKLANKSLGIPGVEYNQVKYYDAWGREQDNGDFLRRFFTNVFSPGYLQDDRSTPYDEELQRLHDAGVDQKVLPQRASQSVKVDDQYLTGQEYELYTKTQGETQYRLIGDLLNSKTYSGMTDDEKAEAISKVYATAKRDAENAVRSERGETVKKTDAQEAGMDESKYVIATSIYSNAKTPNGYKTTSSGVAPTWAKMLAVLNDSSLSKSDRLKFVNAKSGKNEDFKTWDEAVEYYTGQKEKAKK